MTDQSLCGCRGRHRALEMIVIAVTLCWGTPGFAQTNNVEAGATQPLVVRSGSYLSSNNVGVAQVYCSGNVPGSSLVGEFNNTSDENRTVVYSLGKVGGYWTAIGRNVGLQGHIPGTGSGGWGVVGSYGGYVSPDQSGIDAPAAWGALGGNTGSHTYAVYSNGDQFSTSGTLWVTSDARLKQNVDDVRDALAIVRALRPSTFEYRPELRDAGIAVPKSSQFGFIAQEVEVVLPSLVRDVELPMISSRDDTVMPNSGAQDQEKPVTYKAIQVLGLIPVLTRAIQELDTKYQAALDDVVRENRALKARLAELEARLDNGAPLRAASSAVPHASPRVPGDAQQAALVVPAADHLDVAAAGGVLGR